MARIDDEDDMATTIRCSAALRQVLAIARTTATAAHHSNGGDGSSSTSTSSCIENDGASAATILAEQLERCSARVTAELVRLADEAAALCQTLQRESSTIHAVVDDGTAAVPCRHEAAAAVSRRILHRFLAVQRDRTAWMDQMKRVAATADRCFFDEGGEGEGANMGQMVWDHERCANDDQNATMTARIILLLSDIGSLLEQWKETSSANNKDTVAGPWVPPSDFERKTTKYWVDDAHLVQVMAVAACAVPVLVFGAPGGLASSFLISPLPKEKKNGVVRVDGDIVDNDDDVLWGRNGKCASQITSVYLDTADLTFYRERLRRSEGAQLLRARWYGPRPLSHEPIFLELKTHHEVWIGTNSVKRRVTILARHMAAFLSTTSSKTQWSRNQAERMVREATPNLSADALDQAMALLLEMKQLVLRHRMRPSVRSVYARVAFQSNRSNALRFTIDRHVRLYDERGHITCFSKSGGDDWCLPDKALAVARHVVLPYAIFEVKLGQGSEMPESIANLIESGLVVEAYKFSKYLSGAAAFHPVKTLPQWADHPKFRSIIPCPQLYPAHRTTINTIGTTTSTNNVAANRKTDRDASSSSNDCWIDGTPPVVVPRQQQQQEPQPFVPTFRFGWLYSPSPPCVPAETAGAPTRKSPASPVRRVEPKTYFANERTFIQWISIAVLLVTIDSLVPDDGMMIVARLKLAVVVCAAAMILYSASVYYYRLFLLRQGRPYGYTDRVGPAFLTMALLLGGTIVIIKSCGSLASHKAAEVVPIVHEGRECYRYTHGMAPVTYRPSAIVAVPQNDLLLVPSFSQVTALTKSTNQPARSLAAIPDHDIVSMALVGVRIFVVAKGKDQKSSLIELAWSAVNNGAAAPDADNDGDDDSLESVGTWALDPALDIESLAYVPQTNGEWLYFGDDQGGVHATPVPPTLKSSGETLLTRQPLNQKIFRRGLDEPKIAALQYLDGILYILHDNAGIIRGWDIPLGILLSEWQLPLLPSADDASFKSTTSRSNQIKGFFLERRPAGNLRGSSSGGVRSSSSHYLLHLAADSPSQLWTIMVDVVNTSSMMADHHNVNSITYPACARDALLLPAGIDKA